MPGGLQVCHESTGEAFRSGLLGHAWEGYLMVHPWGFRLDQVQIPVDLWHGTDDIDAPVGMGRAVAAGLRNCRARLLEGEGHLLIFKYWGEILDALT